MRRTFHESLSGKRDKVVALLRLMDSCHEKTGTRAKRVSVGKGVRDSIALHAANLSRCPAEQVIAQLGPGFMFGGCHTVYDSGLADNAVEVICEVPDAEAPLDTLFSASSLRMEGGAQDEKAGRKGPSRDAGDLPAA